MQCLYTIKPYNEQSASKNDEPFDKLYAPPIVSDIWSQIGNFYDIYDIHIFLIFEPDVFLEISVS